MCIRDRGHPPSRDIHANSVADAGRWRVSSSICDARYINCSILEERRWLSGVLPHVHMAWTPAGRSYGHQDPCQASSRIQRHTPRHLASWCIPCATQPGKADITSSASRQQSSMNPIPTSYYVCIQENAPSHQSIPLPAHRAHPRSLSFLLLKPCRQTKREKRDRTTATGHYRPPKPTQDKKMPKKKAHKYKDAGRAPLP